MAGEPPTQDGRLLALSTGCGPDVMLITGLTGHEGVSQLYKYQVEAIVHHQNLSKVDWAKLLGQPASVVVRGGEDLAPVRHFSGICNRVAQGESQFNDEPYTRFRLEIVPRLWLLSRSARSDVYHGQTVQEIVADVLARHNVPFRWTATEALEKRDFCVQYRETDFNFVSRLLEEEGIFYYFQHAAGGGHEMVISSPPNGFAAGGVAADHLASAGAGPDAVWSWEKMQEIRSGSYMLRDYSFEKTGDWFESEARIQNPVTAGAVTHDLKPGTDGLELYDYPGEFSQRFDGIDRGGGEQAAEVGKIAGDGRRTIKIRMEEEIASAVVIHGSSGCRGLVAGFPLKLKAQDALKTSGEYVVTSVQHVARQGSYFSGSSGPGDYQNSFACIPNGVAYRPPRLTPKPVVHGTQTAVVVGSSDSDEIFTDKYGRVKVKFHWDRRMELNPDSSCWVRVGTPWAGAQWGAVCIPRVGQEVLVAFEEGDPDQPIVVGSVYNDAHMPPYLLPDNKTQSGIKSRSTLQGDSKNFNEIRFEDKKDAEQVYVHAERDMDRVVENNDTLKIGFDKKDEGNQTTTIFNNQTIDVGCKDCKDGSQAVTIYNDQTLTVGDPSCPSGSQTVTVYKDLTETVKTGNVTKKVEKGNRAVEISMGNDSLNIKMGNETTKLDLGKSETEAMQSIELKVGQSSIKVDQMGVTIKGMMIKVEGQVQTEVKGLMTTVQGTAMLTAKGGITMIN